jgi:sterol desaturase/sphingolipid hydroxylase (fatty acid hydroxylase superfamily)
MYDQIHEWLVQKIVLQVLYFFDGMGYADDVDLIVDWFLLGILQICIIAFILRPLEKKEEEVFHSNAQSQASWLKEMKQAIRVDIFYSSFHRLGLFQLMFFMLFSGVFFYLGGLLHDLGFLRMNIEGWLPSITSIPAVSFLLYLVLFDLIDYGYHRLSHRFNFWWKLHALHHSQRHMTAWSDNRNHLVDDLYRAFIFSGIGLFLGVQPSQFMMLIVTGRLIQSWQHGFYPYRYGFLKYLIVTPNFHRYHHAIDLGYEVPGKPGVLGGCNFGVLFPWWDMLFKTAQFDEAYYPSGVRNFSPPNSFVQQQWMSLKISWQSLFKKV